MSLPNSEPPDLITLREPRSAGAEAYRTLRTSIQFAAVDKPVHTLILTACATEDGKSAAVANLAVTLAQSGSSVIVVDADLRRPAQHTLWKLANERGLTSMILDDSVLKTPPLNATAVPGLRVLTSGPLPPNPADLISGKRMAEAIGVLKAQADYVLFDTPPVLAVTDTALLATKVDAALLVVRADSTRRDHARRAKETLARLNIRLIGAALTNAPRDASAGQYGQYAGRK